MRFDEHLEECLEKRLPGQVVYMPGWRKVRRKPWPRRGVPIALMAHHTAGAATSSRNPRNRGNQKGANQGIINFIQNHYRVPAANFTLDRDGTVYVHSAFPVWHAGRGSFHDVKRFNRLRIPKNRGNDYMLGVEIVSKGRRRDFTKAQKVAFGKLANASRDAAGWKGFWMRLPNHKTWAPRRKIDTKYSLKALRRWARKFT